MKRNTYEYATYTKRDLLCMLSTRNLPLSGNKPELVARLSDYDSHHPFPFLKLPGEIRNEIYRYVATSDNGPRKRSIISAGQLENQSSTIDMGNKQNSASITAPGLFYICSQVYHESRVFFYRYHDFSLYIWQDYKSRTAHWKALLGSRRHNKCMERMFSWLDAIGADMRKEIQTLDIELQCYESVSVEAYSYSIDDLHDQLSDNATVVYRSVATHPMNGLAVLWGLGKAFYERDPGQVPRLEYPAWAVPSNGPAGDEDNIWYWGSSPFSGYPPRRRSVEVPSLTFEPGARWFGGELEGVST